MHADPHDVEALARRIAAVDPTGSVPEASVELRRLHRELRAAVGAQEAARRFDAALFRVLDEARRLRPTPYLPAA